MKVLSVGFTLCSSESQITSQDDGFPHCQRMIDCLTTLYRNAVGDAA